MRQGRHSRRKADDWDTEPSRSAERASAIADEERDPSKRSPGRKDKDHCKPARGPHVPVMVNPSWCANKKCQWRLEWQHRTRSWAPEWLCFHQQACSACGKFFRHMNGDECPDWHPIRTEQQQAFDEEIARRTAARQRYESRKPVAIGPQGYRRKKVS